MSDDFRLIAAVAVVWSALALIYALAPMLYMPGNAEVWGLGALAFVGLAVLLYRAEKAGAQIPTAKPGEVHGREI